MKPMNFVRPCTLSPVDEVNWMRAAMKLLSFITAFCGFIHAVQAADEAAPAYADILKIDAHSHVFEDIPAYNDLLRRINVRTVNICVVGAKQHLFLMHRIALDLYRKHPDLYPFSATFDLLGRDQPGYTDKVIAHLDGMFQKGALAVKIWKEIGMSLKRPDGTFLMPDDPLFDPIYSHLEELGKPLHAHIAEPLEAWLPLDPNSVNYAYYARRSEWHMYGKAGYPTHAELIAARDHILEKHPKLIVIAVHLGSLEHDLDAIAARFERFPNFYIDTGARTRNLVRHPSDKVRQLFLKHPDRILYGVDLGFWLPNANDTPASDAHRSEQISKMELQYKSDYDYYAGKGMMTYDGREVQALNLPRSVLEKFYHENAERVLKLKQAWEQK